MAARAMFSRHRQKTLDTTFEELNSTPPVEEQFFDGKKDGKESDEPVVFVCGQCRLAVGDSLSWDGSEEGQNQIKLKRITTNVVVGEEGRLGEVNKLPQCVITDLTCRGCGTVLGMVYMSTPKDLDYMRYAFYLNVAQIDSYLLGSASQITPAEGLDEQPVTMEYKASVDQELRQMKTLFLAIADKLEELEASY